MSVQRRACTFDTQSSIVAQLGASNIPKVPLLAYDEMQKHDVIMTSSMKT